MSVIRFNTVVEAEQVIRPPEGVRLPQGEIEVIVRPRGHEMAQAIPGLDPARDWLPALIAQGERAAPVPRPGPGICKGMITYMAPDFDAPLEDMKEYME